MEKELHWLAIYEDETMLAQYNEDGTENPFSGIDRDVLTEFHLIDPETKEAVYSMSLEDGQRLIYRRRVSMDGRSGERNWVIYLVGWQKTVKGKNVQSLTWVMPNGRIINTGKFKQDHPLFYDIVHHDFEKDLR